MAKIDVIDEYETLLTSLNEIRAGLESLHGWLAKDINWDSQCELYDFISKHSSQFAILNLIMYRLDNLDTEHRAIIEKAMKGN